MFHHDPDQFRSDQIIAPPQAPVLRGLTGGTLLETGAGWRPVDAITVGDMVQTFDGGLRPVVALRRHYVTRAALIEQGVQPVRIGGGTLNACSDLWVMPAQGVLCPVDPRRNGGQEHRLCAARDLAGRPGVTRRPARAALALTELGFAEEEVVWANTGVLLHCPAAGAWRAPWGIFCAPESCPAAVPATAQPALAVA